MLADASETKRTPSILIGSLVVLSLVAFAIILFRHANQVRAATEASIAEEIAREDRTFCGNLGISPETPRYAGCAKDLMVIRMRHQERIASDGVL